MKTKVRNLIAATLALATIGTSAVATQNLRVIRNDSGGNVNAYMMDVNLAIVSGQRIRIDGWCASACTLYLASANTCVTANAKFGFHAPFGGTAQQNAFAAREMASRLPGQLGSWYLSNAANLSGGSYVALSAGQVVNLGGARFC